MKPSTPETLHVIGGGLAGCEAALHIARREHPVVLHEMRPARMTPAHSGGGLAELVCSNSLGSRLADRPSGLLMAELERLGSPLLECARSAALPAGGALAVDRVAFSRAVEQAIAAQPQLRLERGEVTVLPEGPTVVASGPLTSPGLAAAIAGLAGREYLYFFDALAPIVTAASIDPKIAFRASRYDRDSSGEGDYLNCPFNAEEYHRFITALLAAERIPLHGFESELEAGVTAGAGRFFEGCLPVEVLAARGEQALAFGPMRPIGLRDPRDGRRPYAVLQLRQDDLAGELYNLVGFQTNLTWPEQERVFRLVPGLEQAEFVRFGQMHRNTFLASPVLLEGSLAFRGRPDLFFAGQLTGVEGYLGSIATGALAGINAARRASGRPAVCPPRTSMLGALVYYITHAELEHFQPMKANFGLLPELEALPARTGKRQKHALLAERALTHLEHWIKDEDL